MGGRVASNGGVRRGGGWPRVDVLCRRRCVGRSTGVVSQAPPAFPRARQHPLVLPLALRFSPPLSLPVVPFYTRCHRLRRRLYFDSVQGRRYKLAHPTRKNIECIRRVNLITFIFPAARTIRCAYEASFTQGLNYQMQYCAAAKIHSTSLFSA